MTEVSASVYQACPPTQIYGVRVRDQSLSGSSGMAVTVGGAVVVDDVVAVVVAVSEVDVAV